MTNLEFNKDKILEEINRGNTLECAVCRVMNKLGKRESCDGINCRGEKMISWLLEEHKEPIKLKQWEYDLMYGL